MHNEDVSSYDYDSPTKYHSWFWYGRFEGHAGGFIPPKGVMAGLLYRAGSIVGWIFGPPKDAA